MGFELAIAAKRDPNEQRENVDGRLITPAKTLTFNASGAFSHEDGVALAQGIDDAISPEFGAYVVCLQSVHNVDDDALLTFTQWVRGRRNQGIDLRLCAMEPHVHDLLEEVGEAGDALMPSVQALNEPPRRKMDDNPSG